MRSTPKEISFFSTLIDFERRKPQLTNDSSRILTAHIQASAINHPRSLTCLWWHSRLSKASKNDHFPTHFEYYFASESWIKWIRDGESYASSFARESVTAQRRNDGWETPANVSAQRTAHTPSPAGP